MVAPTPATKSCQSEYFEDDAMHWCFKYTQSFFGMNADKTKAPVVYYYRGFSFKKYQ